MAKLTSLEVIFEEELRDIYDAEKRLTKALPKLVKRAESEELSNALQEHLDVTTQQVARLENVFESIGARVSAKPCAGMKGLIEEGQEVLESDGEQPFLDLAIIGAARRVEHYEMAAYMNLIDIAEEIHDASVTEMLRENLQEEEEADETLVAVARSLLSEAEGTEEAGEEMETEDSEEAEAAMPAPRSAGRRVRE